MAFKLNKRAVAIGAVGIGAVALLTGFAKASSKTTPGKPECPPFRKIPQKQLDDIVSEAVKGGMKGLERIASHVGATLYPVDPESNMPILWPKSPPYTFPAGTPPYVLCLYNELKKIISEKDVPEEPSEPESPAKIFNQLISAEPTPGKFFKIKSGWIAMGPGSKRVNYQALKKVSQALAQSGKGRYDYLRCLTQSKWNRGLYGAPKKSSSWSDAYGFDTEDGKYWLWPAFMPWHTDAISQIVSGKMPKRSITPGGDKVKSGTYGLLWLPPIDAEIAVSNNLVGCDLEWPDGSSSLEPPAELLNLLEV